MPHKALAWWKYNPIYQKPTTLEPVVPWSWYYYYGPDPAAGISYGQYEDQKNDFSIITQKSETVYSPMSGEPLVFISDVPFEEVKSMLHKAESSQSLNKVECSGCKTKIVSDMDLSKVVDLKCAGCGNQVGQERETKTMGIDRQGLKERIKAAFDKKREIRVSEAKLQERRKAVAERIRLRRSEKVKAESEEMISVDEIMEAMNKITAEEAVEKQEAKAEEAPKIEEKAKVEEVKEEMPAQEAAPEVKEEAKEAAPAEKEPLEKADEYMDLDMVLSMVQKKERLARARRKARAKLAERVKTQAEAEPDMISQENPIPEMKAEEKAAEAPKEEPKMEEKKAECAKECAAEEEKEDEKMQAMKFEPIASMEQLATASRDSIDMILFGEASENPTWNVMVAGMPAARIQLKSQRNPDEIRSVFCSDEYAADLIDHCGKSGFLETLKVVNAEMWANHTSNSKIAAKFKAEADTRLEQEKSKHLASFKEDFMNCLQIVTCGINKSFFPELGNPLKEALFANLTTVGLPENTAVSSIEKAFVEASADFFNALFTKAEEYMTMPKEARSEIAKAVASSNAMDPYKSVSLESAEPATLADRLVKASVVPQMSGLRVESSLRLDEQDYKSQLRQVWKRK